MICAPSVDVRARGLRDRFGVGARELHDARLGLTGVIHATLRDLDVFHSRRSELIISEAARPAPRRRQRMRNGRSVTPAMGASTTSDGNWYGPIRKSLFLVQRSAASLTQAIPPPLAGRHASISKPTASVPGSAKPISASMRWPAERNEVAGTLSGR